ncbi:hypothetical protein, partial [Petrachloros mirabilis]
NEAGMGQYLGDVIKKVVPNLKVIDERQTISFINKHGLTVEYAQMRSNLELTHILDREILRKIGDATGAQYVFQPRLAHFSQTMTDRWTVPAFNFLASQTRSGTIRLSLQLWEINTGELLWSSTAEANLQSEAVNQDPVFIEDAARVTFGSMLADLLNRRTSSNYTPLNQVLDRLIKEARHTETNGSKNEKPHEPEKSSNEP